MRLESIYERNWPVDTRHDLHIIIYHTYTFLLTSLFARYFFFGKGGF
jgi:hypothetical protein